MRDRGDAHMGDKRTFGAFLTQKRKERDISLRGFARLVGISAEYICNIEKCRRPAPAPDVLKRIAAVLTLSKEEEVEMYDLASGSKNTENAVPEDLTGFLNENHVILTALRTAKDVDATDEEWQAFMQMLRDNRKKKGRGEDG
jgi:transcriptional regulator with XRE-family HTH domain